MINDLFLKVYVRVKNVIANEKGQALAEYGLILALIAIVCITALSGLGTQIAKKFNEIVTVLKDTTASGT